jgi:hypothetical protein
MAENWWSNPGFKKFASEGLQDLGYGLANSTNFGNAFGAATTRMQQMEPYRAELAQQEEEKAKLDEQTNVTRSWLEQQGFTDLVPLVDAGQAGLAYGEALKRMQPGYGQVGGGNVSYGVNPIYGRFEDGTMGMGVMGDDGTFKPVDTGGMTPLGPYDTNALKAAGTAYGRNTGGAQFDLPAAQLTTQQTLDAITSVRNQSAGMEEQFGNILGVPQQILPTMPASERANFQIETNRLINRTFLEAREVLRGGGQITDFESRKAEGAISNLEEAMARGDKELFQKSLNELEQAVRDGYAKLETQASVMPGFGGGQQQAPASGQNFVYNPATGQLEPQ